MEPNSDNIKKSKKKELPSELRKEAKKYREKRDLWKERTAIKRKQLQIAMSKVTDVEESRDKWKKDAKDYKTQLEYAQQELKKTQQDLVIKENEIEKLKKKLKF